MSFFKKRHRETLDVAPPSPYSLYPIPIKIKKRHLETLDVAPPILYSLYPIPIKKAKADDLKKLVSDYVPNAYQPFYSNLPVTDEDEDD